MTNNLKMSNRKPELYRWKRISEPKMVYSRSQKVTTTDDVQDWIKKVEDASNMAAAATFGIQYGGGRNLGKAKANKVTSLLREDDAALTEAQDLLTQWMSDKVDVDAELEYVEEKSRRSLVVENSVKMEWDHLLQDAGIEGLSTDDNGDFKLPMPAEDPYTAIEHQDEDILVDKIMRSLMEKEVVPQTFVNDLGFNETKKQKDPRVKMQVRHQQVKENREKRERELEKQRRERQAKKDAHFQAQQMILREEKEKNMRAKREELELQKEMARIRKQMQEERKKEEERKLREKQQSELLEQQAREEFERQREEEERRQMEHLKKIDEKRVQLMKRLEEVEKRKAADNLKILHKHFSAWYNVVLEKRIAMGKVKAMADWKCLLRAWNAWKTFVRAKRLEREAQHYEQDLKNYHRKVQQAESHHRSQLLFRYFHAWQMWLKQEQLDRQAANEQSRLQSKMAALLDAAATGRLWSSRQEGEGVASGSSHRPESAREKVDALFEQPARPRPQSARSSTSTLDSFKVPAAKKAWQPQPATVPTQPWQVTKKHVHLSKKELAAMGNHDNQSNPHDNPPGPHGDYVDNQSDGQKSDGRTNQKKAPWQREPFMVNSHSHRTEAQKEMLKKQREQIQEQQKMIEELQFQQNQLILQQQLKTQRTIREQLNQMTIADVTDEQMKKMNKEPEKTDRSGGSTARSAVSESSEKSDNTAASKKSMASSKFLKNMEARSAERARLKAEREERKRKAEEEQLAKLEQEAEERRLQEEEEKRARIEARKEQKRLEKQRELEKQKMVEKAQQQMKQAEEHYRLALLKHKGFLPWRKLMDMSRNNMEVAVDHANTVLLRNCLLSWHAHTKEVNEEKTEMADEMAKFLISRRCFNNWKQYGRYMTILEEKADRFYVRHLQVKILRAWAEHASDEKFAGWERDRIAKEHNEWRLLNSVLKAWKEFPKMLKAEREKERRREEMRKKVASILPDFEGLP
ncbi:coiled-coil domain-containing protein 191-like [Lingula anatina]|uniref:Coiled-coil domain-containing protein 191-like n=1 Tax=Lingula anatina TaxID=7574 RepID=A0A1S3JMH3_LINAN|nr:coiled-coil domain-containing protein 191-like [Lingula anatina]|eukprot:XP_013411610.1 coiled-coil domain-containing protein 191-like [Lingula anatina]